jgi:hypothetical protein
MVRSGSVPAALERHDEVGLLHARRDADEVAEEAFGVTHVGTFRSVSGRA